MKKLILILSILIIAANAEEKNNLNKSGKKDTVDFKPNYLPTLEIPFRNGEIKIDGNLDDDGWKNASVASNFSEVSPGDRVKPKSETKALITYDNENLYIAFIAFDEPTKIRYSYTERDGCFSDDVVGIILDTYGDATWAYEFFANPLGLQGDLRWTTSGEEINFDIIYYSKGNITDSGYQVELAIPFSSLRFPNKEEQIWRATFWRNHQTDTRRQYSWAAIEQDNSCFLCQFGYLKGIKNIKSVNKLEVLPSLIGYQTGKLENLSNPESKFKNNNVDGDVSLGMKYSITPSLTTEITLNPDFSQVESDASQIDINSTFALFYPERRPFFQEAGDLLNSRINLIYTRSINDPILGARLTGRLNGTSIAYISAYDEHSPYIIPLEERSFFIQMGKSFSNIFRYKQSLGEESYIGAIITDRRFDNGAGTVFSIDGVLRFLKYYKFNFQTAANYTVEPNDTNITSQINGAKFDDNKHTVQFDGESYWGRSIYSSLSRSAKYWSFNFNYLEWSPTFRADNGFITSNNIRQFSGSTNLVFYATSNKFLDLIIPEITFGRKWNFDGLRKDQWLVPELYIQFKGQTHIDFYYLWSSERFKGFYFPGIKRSGINFNSNFFENLSLYFNLESGRFISRNLETPVLGKGNNINIGSTIKLFRRFFIEPNYSFSNLKHPETDETIFNGYILRTRFTYQFTRELFCRMVVQYNNFNKNLNLEPLLYYKLNPFTIFYIGATMNYLDYENDNNFTNTQRQYFLKFQYLFQI